MSDRQTRAEELDEHIKKVVDQAPPLTQAQRDQLAVILARPANERLRLNTTQAAEYANRHRDTILRALESGELHGSQRNAGGRWSIRTICLDAWIDGQPCVHDAARSEPNHR